MLSLIINKEVKRVKPKKNWFSKKRVLTFIPDEDFRKGRL